MPLYKPFSKAGMNALLQEADAYFDASIVAWQEGDYVQSDYLLNHVETWCNVVMAQADALLVLKQILPTAGSFQTTRVYALLNHVEASVGEAAAHREAGDHMEAARIFHKARIASLLASTHCRVQLALKVAV